MKTKPVQVVNQSTTSKETKLFLYLEDYYNIKKGQLVFEEFNPYGSSMGLHLNFISTDPNEEIKEGDWYTWKDGTIRKSTRNNRPRPDCNGYKIIASTDPSLGLPAIPEEWIRDVYVPSNGSIKEVELLLEAKYDVVTWQFSRYDLSINDNNEVEIVDENIDKLPYPELVKEISEYYKDVKIVENSVDQELEDAAKDHARYGGPFSTHEQNYEYMFKQGANWKAEQLSKTNQKK